MTIYEILFAFLHKLINILNLLPQSTQDSGVGLLGMLSRPVVIVTQILIKFYVAFRFSCPAHMSVYE